MSMRTEATYDWNKTRQWPMDNQTWVNHPLRDMRMKGKPCRIINPPGQSNNQTPDASVPVQMPVQTPVPVPQSPTLPSDKPLPVRKR